LVPCPEGDAGIGDANPKEAMVRSMTQFVIARRLTTFLYKGSRRGDLVFSMNSEIATSGALIESADALVAMTSFSLFAMTILTVVAP
jgi:hypothetical protein